MYMGKKILLAVTIAAAVSGSAFAAEQGRENQIQRRCY
jgi:hypothetical protein